MDLLSTRILSRDTVDIDPNTVYIGNIEEILAHPNRSLLTDVICAGRDDLIRTFLDDTSANVMAVDGDCPVGETLNAVQRVFDFYNACDRTLKDRIINGTSLQELLDATYDFFGSPILLFDSALMVLAHSCRGREDELDYEWKATLDRGYTSVEVVNDLRAANLLSYLDTLDHPIFIKYNKSSHRVIQHNILLDGKRVANLSVLDISGDLKEGHLYLADYIASIIGSFMSRYMDQHHARVTPFEKLVFDLLDGNTHKREVIVHFLSLIKWKIDDSYYLLKINPDQDDVSGGTIEYSAALVRKLFAGSFVLEYRNDLIVLINVERHRGSVEESFKAMEEFLQRRGFKSGTSPLFNDFSTVQDQYRLAAAAIDLGSKFRNDQCLYYFNDYALHHMIEACSRTMNLKALCHPDAIRLYNYDKSHGTNLLQSLHTYLVSKGGLSSTAELLGIHRNTLVYRLGRITDMMQGSLKEGETRFRLILSCRILAYIDESEEA